MNAFRRRSRRAAMAVRRTLRMTTYDDDIAMVEEQELIVRLLAPLSPRQRAAIVLTDLLDYSSEEAARMLGLRPGAVRSLASRGRAALRQHRKAEAMNQMKDELRRARAHYPVGPDSLESSSGTVTAAFARRRSEQLCSLSGWGSSPWRSWSRRWGRHPEDGRPRRSRSTRGQARSSSAGGPMANGSSSRCNRMARERSRSRREP